MINAVMIFILLLSFFIALATGILEKKRSDERIAIMDSALARSKAETARLENIVKSLDAKQMEDAQ